MVIEISSKDVHYMGQYVYAEVLRCVSPVEPNNNYGDYSFHLLGGVDALYISTKKSDTEPYTLHTLRDLYRQRSLKVPCNYDRQPIYIYTIDEIPDNDTVLSSCSEWPCVFALFQLDDRLLKHTESISAVDKIICLFENFINEKIKGIEINLFSQLRFRVFWNIGESDIVVMFRNPQLYPIMQLLPRLNSNTKEYEDKGIRVLSSSSHIGFPNTNSLLNALKKWLGAEEKLMSSEKARLYFYYMFNLSYMFSNQKAIGKSFGIAGTPNIGNMCGDWDIGSYDLLRDFSVNRIADRLVEAMQENDRDAFRTMYTLPVFKFPSNGNKDGNADSNINREELFQKIYSGTKQTDDYFIPFSNLANAIRESTESRKQLGEVNVEQSALVIEGFGITVYGLYSYLFRLLVGRFEQDLFDYMVRILNQLTQIANDMCERLPAKPEYINMYIEDTASIVSELQHVFTVMSISPHTFLETYGCTMRSLSASCKLMLAYNGVLKFINDAFTDPRVPNPVSVLFPWRYIRTEASLLYESAYLDTRIAKIRIDYKGMFDKDMLFAVIHEAAHYATDKCRDKRMVCYTNSVLKHFAYKSLFDADDIVDVKEIIAMPLMEKRHKFDSEEEIRKELDSFFIPSTVDLSIIINAFINNWVCGVSEKLMGVFDTERIKEKYTSLIEKTIVNSLKCTLKHDEKFFNKCISVYQKNRYTSDDPLDFLESGEDQERLGFAALLLNIFAGFALYIEENCIGNTSDDAIKRLPTSLHLKEYYRQFAELDDVNGRKIPERYVRLWKRIIGACNRCDVQKMAKSMTDAFGEIYSDVFALSVLRVGDPKDYINYIVKFAGAKLSDVLNDKITLIRIRIVFDVMFPECRIKDACEQMSEELRNMVVYESSRLSNAIWVQDISEYAEHCKQELQNKINTVSVTNGTDKEMLDKWYKDMDVNAIYHFWKYGVE